MQAMILSAAYGVYKILWSQSLETSRCPELGFDYPKMRVRPENNSINSQNPQ